jgi:hypothetical protein
MSDQLIMFPKLSFYSLKQAAAELNIHFKSSHIDESHLLSLAAIGEIFLSIGVKNHYKLKCYVNGDGYDDGDGYCYIKGRNYGENYYYCVNLTVAHYIIDKDRFNNFLKIDENTAKDLLISGHAFQTSFSEIFIHDSTNEIRKRLDLYIEDIKQNKSVGMIGIEPILFEKRFMSC